jgi:hypothetical protein
MATGMIVGARLYPNALVTTLVVIAAVYILSVRGAFAPKQASGTFIFAAHLSMSGAA